MTSRFPRHLWVGLDVGEASTNICVLGADPQPILECSVSSSAAEIAERIAPLPPDEIATIAMESGAAHSLVRQLGKLGFPVVLFDAGKVSRFLSIRSPKNDRNDARGIAEIARQGQYSHLLAYVRDPSCQQIRDELIIRQQLVYQRTASRNALRSMLRNQGSHIRKVTSGKGLRDQVEQEIQLLEQSGDLNLAAGIRALLNLHEAQTNVIRQADDRLARLSARIPVVQRFLGIPGVGPICAISFYSAICDPLRFSNANSVGAYLGMVPRLKQSGLQLRRTGITRAGDAMTRGHLVLSAGVLISRAARDNALRDWGCTIAEKKGYGRARMAVARKLAVVMLSMWKSGQDFIPYPASAPGGAMGQTSCRTVGIKPE